MLQSKFQFGKKTLLTILLSISLHVTSLFAQTTVDCNNVLQTGVPRPQCQALVDLYNSTNGANWTNKTNWMTSNSISTWHGVYVNSSAVSILSLDGNNLVGSIPTSIGNLVNLTALTLSSNHLNGSTIPTTIGNLVNLRELWLHNNQLSGSIPTSIGNLVQLTYLTLGVNQLSGSIPASIGNLVQLTYLFLHDNQLSGSIPTSIGNLVHLTDLFLNNNQLTGSIPTSIGNLVNLSYLDLSLNHLGGTIPQSFANLHSLYTLSLSYNSLTGYVPTFLSTLPISRLNLSNNFFYGTFTQANIASTLGGQGTFLNLAQNCINDLDSQTISYLLNHPPQYFYFYPQRSKKGCININSDILSNLRFDSSGNRIEAALPKALSTQLTADEQKKLDAMQTQMMQDQLKAALNSLSLKTSIK